MAIKKHDFVELEYTGRIKDSNEVFDTTDEKTAKDSQIHAKGAQYKPIVICVGEKHMLPGLDDFILGKELGEYTVELAPEHAFGKKDPEMLKMIPTSKFEEQGIKPVTGLRLNIDGHIGIIKSSGGGRTVVDFNHPLAGRDVVYQIKLKKLVTDKKVQVESVLKVLLGLSTKVEVSGSKANVEMPQLPQEILDELSKNIKELTGVEVEYTLTQMPSHEHVCDDPNHKH